MLKQATLYGSTLSTHPLSSKQPVQKRNRKRPIGGVDVAPKITSFMRTPVIPNFQVQSPGAASVLSDADTASAAGTPAGEGSHLFSPRGIPASNCAADNSNVIPDDDADFLGMMDDLMETEDAADNDVNNLVAIKMEDILAEDKPLLKGARRVIKEVWKDATAVRTDIRRTRVVNGIANTFAFFTMAPIGFTQVDPVTGVQTETKSILTFDLMTLFVEGLGQLFAVAQQSHILKKKHPQGEIQKTGGAFGKKEWETKSNLAVSDFFSRHPTCQLFCEDLVAMLASVRAILAEQGIDPLPNDGTFVHSDGGSSMFLEFPNDATQALMARQRVTVAIMSLATNKRVRIQPSAIPLNAIPVLALLLLEFMRLYPAKFCKPGTNQPAFDFDIVDSSRLFVTRTSAVSTSELAQELLAIGHSVLQIAGYKRAQDCKASHRPPASTRAAKPVASIDLPVEAPNANAVGSISLRFIRTNNPDGYEARFDDEAPSQETVNDFATWLNALTPAERACVNEEKFMKATVTAAGIAVWICPYTRVVLMNGEVPFPHKVIGKSAALCNMSNMMSNGGLLMSHLFAKLKGVEPHRAGTDAMCA
jgi:hypothetical protein